MAGDMIARGLKGESKFTKTKRKQSCIGRDYTSQETLTLCLKVDLRRLLKV